MVFFVKDKGAPILVPANEIKHYKNRPDWYAAYIVAEQAGQSCQGK